MQFVRWSFRVLCWEGSKNAKSYFSFPACAEHRRVFGYMEWIK